MSTSTDAILCYGFRLKNQDGDEDNITIDWLQEKDGEGEMEFEEFLAKLAGITAPEEDLDENRYDTDPSYKQAWSDYWKKKRGLENEVGVTLISHCHSEYKMYILAVQASVQKASRGTPIELGQSIAVEKEWRQKLQDFCRQAGIPFEEPQLILCSYWG